MINNDPAQIVAALRTLALYAVCVTLAIILGVLMTNPLTYSSLTIVAILCAVMFIPILLRWHQPLMIFCWNAPFMAFFLKGDPKLSLAMIAISFAISVTERALNQKRFINVPQLNAPLIALIAVVLFTAKMTGGIGLHAFGSDVMGGKKYIFLIMGIMGYFAVTARPIPPEKARRYVMYFFLGGTLIIISDLYPILPGFTHPIFWLIPPMSASGSFDVGTTRLVGTSWAAVAGINALLARYGVRGIFLSGKLWRPCVFFLCLFLIFFGGFRSALVSTLMTFTLLFYLEGMHRTRVMPFFVIFTLAIAAAVIPLASKLPFTFQRTLAFVPESVVHLSTDARLAAQASTDWRLDMWRALLPQVSKHLILGKGYALTMEDYAAIGIGQTFQSIDPAQEALAISGDYHSGPLSVIIPFGIWGAIAWVWFNIAGIWVVYRNFRYGDASLRTINTFLFTAFVMSTFSFYFIAGGLAEAGLSFTGMLGMSVAINNGVCRAPYVPARNIPFKRAERQRFFTDGDLGPQPAFQKKAPGAASP